MLATAERLSPAKKATASTDADKSPEHEKKDSIVRTQEFFEAIKKDGKEKEEQAQPLASGRRTKQARGAKKQASIASKGSTIGDYLKKRGQRIEESNSRTRAAIESSQIHNEISLFDKGKKSTTSRHTRSNARTGSVAGVLSPATPATTQAKKPTNTSPGRPLSAAYKT